MLCFVIVCSGLMLCFGVGLCCYGLMLSCIVMFEVLVPYCVALFLGLMLCCVVVYAVLYCAAIYAVLLSNIVLWSTAVLRCILCCGLMLCCAVVVYCSVEFSSGGEPCLALPCRVGSSMCGGFVVLIVLWGILLHRSEDSWIPLYCVGLNSVVLRCVVPNFMTLLSCILIQVYCIMSLFCWPLLYCGASLSGYIYIYIYLS